GRRHGFSRARESRGHRDSRRRTQKRGDDWREHERASRAARRTASIKRMAKGDIGIEDVLLSYAADSGADFMVMGGYGHSRLREFILGGVTRGILASMTVPVLMSH